MPKRTNPFFCICVLCSLAVISACNGIRNDSIALHPADNNIVSADHMTFIKGGCFNMGDEYGEGDPNEVPVHKVCVDDFYVSRYEVTLGEFRSFVNETGYITDAEQGKGCYRWDGHDWKQDKEYNWQNLGFKQTENDPVACVSWDDAGEYIKWITARNGRNYRLLTEAEWEYACRSGGKQEKFAGFSNESVLHEYANFCDKNCELEWKVKEQDDGYINTSPVGRLKPNGLGLYDMSGNVWEWIYDFYDKDYYKYSIVDNPDGPAEGNEHGMRGGRWDSELKCMRCANRYHLPQDYRGFNIGFRLAMTG